MVEKERLAKERGDLPWGIRLTAGFLELFAVLVALPTCLVGFVALMTVQAANHKPEDVGEALVATCFMAGLFLVLLSTMMGAGWLAVYIRANHQSAAGSHGRRCRREPVQIVVEPVLMAFIIFCLLSVIGWCIAKLGSEQTSFTWLMFWTIAGGGSSYLYWRIRNGRER